LQCVAVLQCQGGRVGICTGKHIGYGNTLPVMYKTRSILPCFDEQSQYSTVWYSAVRYSTVWYGMGMVWYSIVRYGIGMVVVGIAERSRQVRTWLGAGRSLKQRLNESKRGK